MTQNELEELIREIEPFDEPSSQKAQEHWNQIAKPLHSLGKLEDSIIKIAGIMKPLDFSKEKFSLDQKRLIIFCADNGIVEEGVTQTGQEVTAIVADNFLKAKSCAAIMCKRAGVQIMPVDVGMAVDVQGVRREKTSYGTKNFLREDAMTRDQALNALETGIRLVREARSEGIQLLMVGEMGIGNTTTSSALASVLLDIHPNMVTGKGAGLSKVGILHKARVIETGLRKRTLKKTDPLGLLAAVGGFDIAAMTGAYIGAARYRMPVVLDGFISKVAALLAKQFSDEIPKFLLASHLSKEPADILVAEALGINPMIHGEFCLGEGTGAVALCPILDMGMDIFQTMSSFEENAIEAYKEL